MRRVLAPAVLAFAALALPAVAGAAPACRLVSDPADDTTVAGPVPAGTVPVDRPAYDIRSADIAADGTWLTVAIRVRALPDAAIGVADGARYDVQLTVGRTRYAVHAGRVVGGTVSGLSRIEPPANPTLGAWSEAAVDADTRATFDAARDEVRISVRTAAFGGIAPGTAISGIEARTWSERALRPMSSTTSTRDRADEAATTRTYVAGTRSCLRPGS